MTINKNSVLLGVQTPIQSRRAIVLPREADASSESWKVMNTMG